MTSAPIATRSGAVVSRAGSEIRTRSSADQTIAPAVTPKTTALELTASRSPPRAGPAKMPTLSIVVAVTFAAVSSSGLRASPGTSAACAGRNAVEATETTTASA